MSSNPNKQTVMENVILRVSVALGKYSPQDPTPKEVRGAIAAVQDGVRKSLLEMHYWSFAEERVKLELHPEKPAFGYDFAFNKPADFISLNYINNTGDLLVGFTREHYDTVGRKISTNFNPAYISYTQDVTDETLMSPGFLTAWVHYLASEICFGVTRDKDLMRELKEGLKDLKMESIEVDFKNSAPEQLESKDYEEARYDAGSTFFNVPNVQPDVTPIIQPGDPEDLNR